MFGGNGHAFFICVGRFGGFYLRQGLGFLFYFVFFFNVVSRVWFIKCRSI